MALFMNSRDSTSVPSFNMPFARVPSLPIRENITLASFLFFCYSSFRRARTAQTDQPIFMVVDLRTISVFMGKTSNSIIVNRFHSQLGAFSTTATSECPRLLERRIFFKKWFRFASQRLEGVSFRRIFMNDFINAECIRESPICLFVATTKPTVIHFRVPL
jgi:hypothetical protein